MNFIIDPWFEKFCAQSMNRAETIIRVGRISMERGPQKELAEPCTWQFFIRARPAAG